LGLDRNISDRVNCRGFSAGENRGFTKVSTGGTEAGLWSKNGGQKDIDPETQSIIHQRGILQATILPQR